MNLRFPGQYFDQETGMHYNGFRYYNPMLGRYIQADPIGLRGGINLYGYVYANPLFYYDPYGLRFFDPLWGLIHNTTGWEPSDDFVNGAAGFGDGIIIVMTYGVVNTKNLRESWDIGNVDTCSGEYQIGKVAGAATAFSVAYYSRYTNWEMQFSKNFRVSPWGHKSNNWAANLPHYHRRG